jgi:hypothetical protein
MAGLFQKQNKLLFLIAEYAKPNLTGFTKKTNISKASE